MLTSSPEQAETIPPKKPASELIYPVRRKTPLFGEGVKIIALSLAVGMGVAQQPLILQFTPDWLKTLLSSGIAAGGLTAITLNLVFPQEK